MAEPSGANRRPLLGRITLSNLLAAQLLGLVVAVAVLAVRTPLAAERTALNFLQHLCNLKYNWLKRYHDEMTDENRNWRHEGVRIVRADQSRLSALPDHVCRGDRAVLGLRRGAGGSRDLTPSACRARIQSASP